jgi:hypothetical protein
MAEIEEMLARRAVVADEIVATIDKLGVLVRQEAELQDQLRRAAERDGSKTNPFSNPVTISDAICAELTRVGLAPHRADARLRLGALVDGQQDRYRRQWAVRKQVQATGKSAA